MLPTLKLESSTLEDKLSNQLIVNFQDLLLFFKPLMKNNGILAVVRQADDIRTIKKWIKEKSNLLENIFEGNIII